jgi:hypothetical protein
MSTILRWFYDNGERHRAFFRHDPATHQRRLIIAAGDWEHTVEGSLAARLEDFSEETLVKMARRSRAATPFAG